MMLCQLGYTQGRVPQSPLPSFKFFQIRPIWEILFFNVIEKYALLQDCTCAVQTTRCHKIGALCTNFFVHVHVTCACILRPFLIATYFGRDGILLDKSHVINVDIGKRTLIEYSPIMGNKALLRCILWYGGDCCIGVCGVNSVGSFE